MMKPRLKQIIRFNNENGMALISVLLVLVVISVMGVSIIGLAANNIKMSSGERNNQSSYYIAESGVTYMMNLVSKNVLDVYNQSDTDTSAEFFSSVNDKLNTYFIERPLNEIDPTFTFEKSFGEQPIAKLKIEALDSTSGKYKIISKGIINNRIREVEKEFQLKWVPKTNVYVPIDKAILVKSNINFASSSISTVTGDIGTCLLDPVSNTIQLSGITTINGKVGVNSSTPDNYVRKSGIVNITGNSGKPVTINTSPNFGMPNWEFPSINIPVDNKEYSGYQIGTLSIAKDGVLSYDKLSVKDNAKLAISLNGNGTLIVNEFTMLSNAKITLTGGKLTVFVMKSITISGNGSINDSGDWKNLDFFVKSSQPAQTITIAGNTKINGSFYAENANINVVGNSGIQGHFMTGGNNVSFGGNSVISRLIYAPNADVTISGNSKIYGAIVSKSLSSNANLDLTFRSSDFETNKVNLPLGNQSGIKSYLDLMLYENPIRER